MKIFVKLLIFSLCFFFAGCATITKGTSQTITIDSNVPGALVELDGVELGYTPFTGKIKKGKERRIKVSKPGYIAGDIEMKKTKEGYASGNMLIGFGAGSPFFVSSTYESFTGYPNRKAEHEDKKSRGENEVSVGPIDGTITYLAFGASASIGAFTIASSIDGLSSAAWEYSPSSYYVQLKEEGQSSLDYSNELAIRYFATVNHSQIAIDAGENNGEYSNALADLMEVNMEREAARQSINEALEQSKGNQVVFGDELIGRFRR
jgi:hypothetical protein